MSKIRTYELAIRSEEGETPEQTMTRIIDLIKSGCAVLKHEFVDFGVSEMIREIPNFEHPVKFLLPKSE